MKTVIEMAREAGYMRTVHGGAEVSMASMDCLERFAELVASLARADAIADEREACVRIAESKRHAPNFQLTSMPPQNGTAVDIANAIRARSNT